MYKRGDVSSIPNDTIFEDMTVSFDGKTWCYYRLCILGMSTCAYA